MITIPDGLERGLWAIFGSFVSLCLAYVAVGRDLAFLKGAMAHVSKAADEFHSFREKYGTIDAEVKNLDERVSALEERTLS